ncbi:polysulfide reductase, NrfD family protein, partial [Vibrio parahaemolyticus AQ3810]
HCSAQSWFSQNKISKQTHHHSP